MQILDEKLREGVSIQNIVSTADLKQHGDIASCNNYHHRSTNLELYRCGYIKDNEMVGKVSVFASGKLISVGTKSPKQAEKELKKATKILVNYKFIKNCRIKVKVQNIVVRFNLGKKVHIETLARTMPQTIYEPEQFPGLIFSMQKSLVALIFSSGKGVMVGGKSIIEINQGMFELDRWICSD